ncbi:MAG: ABC transporter ATP-binding protein [Ignavibacteria bacterium]|jgi:lipoprotein-releasing system ATP-binding protein|nr:ABC transporter ATP-binding protein [Ignavibacteria bacterium]MCU7504968.1 ABC transporter ATP-binding protein [Ignavibacteria bacterium]MCU7514898.1 ABC transporter ATP-binding protein [Ignavibacteria bacterium]
MPEAIIRFEHVSRTLISKSNGVEVDTTILPDLSFEIERGEFTAITGPSGSGKTTMLYLMGGLDKPTTGKVFLEDLEISSMNEDELSEVRNAKLGFVYQFHFLLPEFSSLENVMMPMVARGRYSAQQARKKATELLSDVGLSDKLNSRPNQLSGGQQQRVAIARALANDPLVLLTDEPTGNLDSKNSAMVFDLFKELNEKHKQTIVVVTHDEAFASKTQRIIHILDGKVHSDTRM